jgi:molybdopterin synthase catalytic subunit
MRDKQFTEADWELAKAQAKAAIVERARRRGMIPYSELVKKITAIEFEPHEALFFKLLGEISAKEFRAGRGMLTALVTHKDGDMQPGPGFFELAQSLGLDTSDILTCWVEQFKKVHFVWAGEDDRDG